MKDLDDKYAPYNIIVTIFDAKDNYIKNLISNAENTIEYQNEELPQVNPQLYEWLGIINGNPAEAETPADISISQGGEKSNTPTSSRGAV
jgi:hypothetical protein